ncbi:hypothetical protein [Legionella jordanis]|uniref:Uncharacterized protein n=1 Tax=Legionella jordanis TaxID=456 RepID=A0A0W0VCC6_9GAMM|nr:hypothetical protein [Legionella jordanis]KTD17767.1 hypothetical protein Ljor_2073 [Legionella jordanis]RMX02527.1 hypothetical protein EAW55_09810 [Legionella jordanis]RMX21625.1 hypothetical protein EAS68_02385 [Legionella jordanis]VEH11297.1 Uncharacterised protein [Legionella jordanis]HAT8714538.1 hypothetical protein [Legionella jordanis]
MAIYTAKLYIEKISVGERSSDDFEGLYIWMLARAYNQMAHYNGSIVNNDTQENFEKFSDLFCRLEII